MNTPLLWRDACAMSKALRKHLVAQGSAPFTPEACTDLVRAIQPTSRAFLDPLGLAEAQGLPDPQSPTSTLRVVAAGQAGPKDALFLGNGPKRGFLRKPTQLFLTDEGLLNQVAVYGCTGAGKTETLLTLALNALHGGPRRWDNQSYRKSRARSVFYVDGKGDPSLYTKAFSGMAERGLLGNLRVINLMGHEVFTSPGESRRHSHSVDLFAGFDEQALAQWLLAMRPMHQYPEQWEGLGHESGHVLAVIARLAVAFGQQTQQRITPAELLSLMTEAGVSDHAQNLSGSMGHLARHLLRTAWGSQANGTWGRVLALMHQWLEPLSKTYAHVFEAATPDLALSCLDLASTDPYLVLVLLPAMEKSPQELQMLGMALVSSLQRTLEKRESRPACDTLVILDEFNHYVPPPIIASLSQLRTRCAGLIWATGHLTPTPGFNEASPTLGWEPATHVFMKQCLGDKRHGGCYGRPYLEHQIQTHAHLRGVQPIAIKDQREGEAHVWDRQQVTQVTMDYANVSRPHKVFIPPGDGVPLPVYAFSGGSLVLADEGRKSVVLQERMAAWQAQSEQAPPLAWCQETVARMLGYASWHEAHRVLGPTGTR